MNPDILSGAEKLINRLIALDMETLEALSGYEGKTIAVDLVNTRSLLVIKILSHGIQLGSGLETSADVTVRGTPLEMVKYLTTVNREGNIQSGRIEIAGDLALAQNIQSILKSLQLDWEEFLSHWTGDTLARQTGRMVRGAVTYFRETDRTLKNNVSEYLRYESEILVDRDEIDDFSLNVDRLRDDTERLKARIERINKAGKQQ